MGQWHKEEFSPYGHQERKFARISAVSCCSCPTSRSFTIVSTHIFSQSWTHCTTVRHIVARTFHTGNCILVERVNVLEPRESKHADCANGSFILELKEPPREFVDCMLAYYAGTKRISLRVPQGKWTMHPTLCGQHTRSCRSCKHKACVLGPQDGSSNGRVLNGGMVHSQCLAKFKATRVYCYCGRGM